MLSDKSFKFAVTDKRTFIEAGKVHTDNGRKIDRHELIEIDKLMSGHCAMWVKMLGIGDDHNQSDRVSGDKARNCSLHEVTFEGPLGRKEE